MARSTICALRENGLERHRIETVSDGNRIVGERTVMSVESERQRHIRSKGVLPTMCRERANIGRGRIGEGVCGCLRCSAGHVGNAIENRVVDGEGGFTVCRCVRVLEATTLVDSNVDENTSRGVGERSPRPNRQRTE